MLCMCVCECAGATVWGLWGVPGAGPVLGGRAVSYHVLFYCMHMFGGLGLIISIPCVYS